MNLLKYIVNCVIRDFNGKFNKFDNDFSCIDLYLHSFIFVFDKDDLEYKRIRDDVSDHELKVTMEALGSLIKSNGKNADAIYSKYNEKMWITT